MSLGDPHALSAATAAFLASLVEFIEALTVVLAVGAVRGWRNALAGAGAALLLASSLAMLGPAAPLPSQKLRFVVGVFTLMFGLRWLRKAVLRAAGVLPLHDEEATYRGVRARLSAAGARAPRFGWDVASLATSFQVVLMEGVEVVFIVAAISAEGGHTAPASIGAGAALGTVLLLGAVLHRPITAIPENALKFAVGVLMTAFGTFWTGEGIGAVWPGREWALPALTLMWALCALVLAWCASRIALTSP